MPHLRKLKPSKLTLKVLVLNDLGNPVSDRTMNVLRAAHLTTMYNTARKTARWIFEHNKYGTAKEWTIAGCVLEYEEREIPAKLSARSRWRVLMA
jgi:hypothetical protein